ncbi:MAG: HEPN domain-containing protein [Patescibacteria group bacterium]
MRALFKIKRYPESLFYGHIILEKMLKALVVQNTKKGSPYTHDLVRLQQLAELDLKLEEIEFLKEVNNFNIRARYPDYKLKFHKLCTKQFVEKMLGSISKLYKKLCQKIK